MTQVFEHVSQSTRQIHFDIEQIKFVTSFVNGMRKLGDLPNLEHISISVFWMGGIGVYPAYKKLPLLTNLTSLTFHLNGHVQQASYGFQPLLQILIDSAPNLTSLNVRSSSYPNLEGCKKNLKVLKFVLVKPAPSFLLDFNPAIKMLAEVKDSLIEMEFRDEIPAMLHSHNLEELDVPVMSKMTSVTIHPAATYLFPDFFNEDHLPRLESLFLSVTNRSEGLALSPHLNLWKPHGGVKSLKLQLGEVDANEIGRQIVALFPSVTKFELISSLGCNNSVLGINQMMPPYQKWDLEEALVSWEGVHTADTLVAVLKNMAAWKGDKSIEFTSTWVMKDDFFPSIKDLIVHSTGFKSVQISGGYWGVVPEILAVIQPILEGSGAPIRITGGVVSSA
ncbi:uncharacterized protein LOC118433251 [Folsomia candida]|nr:uncharacterized protein LOC118433251 [Folsomia candida]